LIGYKDDKLRQIYAQISERLEAVPGVQGVTFSRMPLLSQSSSSSSVFLREALNATPNSEGQIAPSGEGYRHVVRENFLQTMGIPLLAGRTFGPQDNTTSPKVVVVNQTFANKFFPDQNAIGKRFRLGGTTGDWVEVVGVAKTGKYIFIGESPTRFLYLPYDQNPRTSMNLIAESQGDPAETIGEVRRLVRSLDANLPLYDARTFSNYYEQRAVSVPRMILQMVSAMGLLGLAIAMVGLYGLIAYTVTRRTQEIGIRVAIGADQSSILRMVLRQGLILGVSGIAIGSVLTALVSNVLTAGLIGLGQPSMATYVMVPAVLLLVTLAASYIPARRAARIDPLIALRYD